MEEAAKVQILIRSIGGRLPITKKASQLFREQGAADIKVSRTNTIFLIFARQKTNATVISAR